MQALRTSFIVPARNAAQTLAQTLDSVLAQSDGNWEALVVDDGSSDDTARIAADYARRDTRFVFVPGGTSSGSGASATRNRGLERARGQRVVFLDSDDWIDASFLARMHAALDAQPGAVVAYCDYCRVMADGSQAPAQGEPGVALDPFGTFARHCAVAIHAVLIERETVLRAGSFDPGLRTCEDWDLWLRVARLGGRWVYVAAALAYYRQRSGSLSCDMAQFVIDGMVVIRRGRDGDPRTPADSNDAGDLVVKAQLDGAYFALWCCAHEAGRGRMLQPMPLDLLGHLPPESDCVPSLVATLVYGLEVGQQSEPKALAARWPNYGHAVVELIRTLGELWRDAVAARRLQYALEAHLLQLDDLAAPRALALSLGLRVDLHRPVAVTPPPGIDRIHGRVCDRDRVLGTFDTGVLGRLDAADCIWLAGSAVGWRPVLAAARWPLLRSITPRRALAALRAAGRQLLRAALRRQGWRRGLKQALRLALQQAPAAARGAGSHAGELDRLRAEAQSLATPASAARPAVDLACGENPQPELEPGGATRHAYWEQLFRTPDPWAYSSAYEQEKYALQLSLLREQPIASALELACAEGHFTLMLAPRVGRLIASDISATAVGRARERCAGLHNIEYRQLDFLADPLPAQQELIVCSEVLYYLPDETALAQVGQRIAAALAPGGHLITAHAFVLDDDLAATGFDWGQPWGAKTISRVLSALPSLALEHSVCTPLYRIDRFVRRDEASGARPTPSMEVRPLQAQLELEVARCIVWGGAVVTRSQVAQRERHERLPVLLYHRIADDGPPELECWRVGIDAFAQQLAWLRRHGYHAIVSDELAGFLEQNQPFVGRPVMITFDDGYQDFADAAWPLLQRHDFRAEVFVVTDLVGQRAEWDCRFGEPAPLMDAAAITTLAGQGARFGSHLATHRGADGLATSELAQELLRSQRAIERWTGSAPCAMAAPFGLTELRLQQLAAECGYRIGFSTQSGPATLAQNPMHLPRVEVRGDMALAEFAATLEASR